MKRILVIGSPGSGKTTATRRIGTALGLPVIHLDHEYFLPGWAEPTPEDWARRIANFIDEPRWIMDGFYGTTLDARLAAADAVVFLDLSPVLCTWRVVKRWLAYRGIVRADDMAPGCPERMDCEFILYVLRFGRDKAPAIRTRLAVFPGKVFHVTTPDDVRLVMSQMTRHGCEQEFTHGL